MPEQKKLTLAQQQAKDKPLIENHINEYLDGIERERALAFVAWLREKSMKPVWCTTNNWDVNYQNKRICTVGVPIPGLIRTDEPQVWRVSPSISHIGSLQNLIFSEGLQDIFWDNVGSCRFCYLCTGSSQETKQAGLPPAFIGDGTVLGEVFRGFCHGTGNTGGGRPTFTNPDDVSIAKIKRLIELEQKAREDEKAALSPQKETIADRIRTYVAGDKQKTALDLIAWVRENGLTTEETYSKNKHCEITVSADGWVDHRDCRWSVRLTFYHWKKHIKNLDVELQDVIVNNLRRCAYPNGNCNPKKPCPGGEDKTVLGMELKNICRFSAFARFYDPDEKTVEVLKRLILLDKQARNDEAMKKAR